MLAAAALLGEEEDQVADALDVLVDAHLLESPEPDRYRFHDLLRVYAADRARTQETEQDRLTAVTRLLTWYLYTAESAARVISPQHSRVPLEPSPDTICPLSFTSVDEALAWSEVERPGLTAATRLAAAFGIHGIAWKLPAAAMSFYYRRSHWGDQVITHQTGLESARALGDRRAEAWMLNNLGMAHGCGAPRRPSNVSSRRWRSTVISATWGGEARSATNLANTYFGLSRFGEALTASQRSLAIQKHAGKRYGEGIALGVMGAACRELGRFNEAIDHLQAALAIFLELGDRMTEPDALSDLGAAHLGLARSDKAIGLLNESLVILQDIGDRYRQAVTLRRLGHAQPPGWKNLRLMRELFTEALQLFEELGETERAAELGGNLALPAEEDG